MGLDLVEMIMAVEEQFEISIADADAATLRTSRQLAAYVFARLPKTQAENAADTNFCWSQVAFYRLRRALVQQFKIPRRLIRPTTVINDILPGDICVPWRELGDAIGSKSFPSLRCKQPLHGFLIFGLPLSVLITLSLLLSGSIVNQVVTVLFFVAASFVTGAYLNDCLGNEIPPKYRQIKALVPYVSLHALAPPWTPETVMQKVIQIVSEQGGIPVEDIKPDDEFVRDLHID